MGVSLENFTSPFAADIEHLPRADKLTAADPLIDGLDAASTPQLICPKAVALPGIGGLALVTNDAVAMSHFRWQLGAWSSLEATFQRGTDPAAIAAVAKATRREVLGVKLTRDADPLVKRSVVVSERDGRAVLRIDTPCFLKTMRDRIRALAPEELKCVAHASFSLDQAKINPGQF